MSNKTPMIDTAHDELAGLQRAWVRLRVGVKAYYWLTKPGIVYSNVMTAVAGCLFAARWHVSVVTFVSLTFGTGLIIAASCVFNNIIDRRIDAQMERTRRRALVTGSISVTAASVYACLLLAGGFALLARTNGLTVIVGVLAVVSYVIIYGVAKRRSIHGTLVGTIPGAASLVAGYTAITGHVDGAALVLFATMVVWQMAHFYAIAMFRRDDYAAAHVPVRSVVMGLANARRHIYAYIVLFIVIAPLLTLASAAGYVYGLGVLALGLWWLTASMIKPAATDAAWARTTFGNSLIVLLTFSTLVTLGSLLP